MEIHRHAEKAIQGMDTSMISDWTLAFPLVFGKSEWIGVYTRGNTYPTTKEREISIVIPIPTLEQAKYGVSRKKFAVRPDLDASKFITLGIDYSEYESIEDWIIACAKKGINAAFKKGIKINGVTLKSSNHA